MRRENVKPYSFHSITELHTILELPHPKHPLISVIDFSAIKCFDDEKLEAVTYGFYCIALKKNFKGKMKYGQQPHDFDEGVMSFFAPRQVVVTEIRDDWELEGNWLVIHPDFLQNFPIVKEIRNFGFFSYAVHEALHLSFEEEETITKLMRDISKESQRPVDTFSQGIIIKQIELLLNYCDRFYHRQFLTRKQGGNGLLSDFEELLEDYFKNGLSVAHGVPQIAYFADKLNLSRNYLSDMLRSITGQSAQQHIQHKLMEKAKEMLTTSTLSVSEIAYELGFEYPQSFNKLFKQKTHKTPLEFRKMFN